MLKLINKKNLLLIQKLNNKFCVQIPKVDYQPPKWTGPSKEEVSKIRDTYTSEGVIKYYKDPIMIVDGHMQYVYDETGKQYLDLIANILCVSVGHKNPYVQEKVIAQQNQIPQVSSLYLHPSYGALAQKLCEKLPKKLDTVFLVNSGSEANDLAVLMAKLHTNNNTVFALNNAYHGWAGSSASLTSLNTWKFSAVGDNGVKHVRNINQYRKSEFLTEEQNEELCVQALQDAVVMDSCGKVAAFWHEPIQGVGGFLQSGSSSYMQKCYGIIRSHGGICVSDEVQTGFGRTGTNFWGFQNQGVVPDMVVMAKGIGNGGTLAAVATTREIADTMKAKVHFNTYGGNPISSTCGLATLEYMEKHKTQENAHKMGLLFIEGLQKLKQKYQIVGDVRGQGLMLAFELVKDRQTKIPASQEMNQFMELAKDNGVLIGKGGIYGNVMRIGPPLIINEEDVKFALHIFDKCLGKL